LAFDGRLKFDTKIDVEGFLDGIKNIGSAAKQGISTIGSFTQKGISATQDLIKSSINGISSAAEKSFQAVRKSIELTKDGMKWLGEQALNLSKEAVSMGQSFEKSMSQVIATMGVTKDTMVEITNADGTTSMANAYDMLSEKAKEMGATTKFSASEAADALNYLALAGYDAQKACNALPAVLNLAAAGDMDLAYASDLATDAMSALNMEATTENLTHFGDSLAKTASSSNTSVAQLGEAILVCGGQATLAKMDLTQMNTALGILADNGIKGSEGGTALRNVLKNLYTPTQNAANAMAELGIVTADANGKLLPAQDVLKQIKGALDGLGDDDSAKMTYMSEIFDTRTIAAANALLSNSNDRWDELSGKIENCDNAMEQMAQTMSDNLEGDIKIWESALEGFGITFYESIVGSLRKTVQEATGWISRLDQAFQTDGLNGLAETAGEILGDMIENMFWQLPRVLKIGNEFIKTLCDSVIKQEGEIKYMGAAIITNLLDSFTQNFEAFYSMGFWITDTLISGLSGKSDKLASFAVDFIDTITNNINTFIPSLAESGAKIIMSVLKGMAGRIPVFIARINETIRDVLNTIKVNLPVFVIRINEIIRGILNTIKSSLPEMLDTGKQIIANIFAGISCSSVLADETISDMAVEIITSLAEFILAEIPVILDAGLDILEGLLESISDGTDKIMPAVKDFVKNLCDNITEHLPEILQTGFDILMSIINGIIENLPEIIDAAVDILLALADFIGDNIGLLIDSAVLIITTICNELLTEENFKKLIDAAIDILNAIADGIADNLPLLINCATNILQELGNYLNDPKNQQDLVTKLGELVGTIVKALIDSIPELTDFVAGLLVELGRAIGDTDWAYLGKCINDGIMSGIFGIDWDSDEFWDYFLDYYNISESDPNLKQYFVPDKKTDDTINENHEKSLDEIYNQDRTINFDVRTGISYDKIDIPVDADTENFEKSLDEIYNQDRTISFDVKANVDNSELQKKLPGISDSYAFNFDSETVAERLENAVTASQNTVASAITSSCEPIGSMSSEIKSGFEDALKNAQLDGDTYLSVNIGNERIDDIVISSIERQNARTGGRY